MRKFGSMKRIVALALSVVLAAGLLGGCSRKDGKDPEPAEGTGKYVEEDVSLPLEPGEEPWYLLKQADGQLEVYTSTVEGAYGRYRSNDGKEWQRIGASWLAAYADDIVTDIVAGADGNDYAVVMGQDGGTFLLKETGEGTAEEIRLPVLMEQEGTGPEGLQLLGTGLLVMEDGRLVLVGNEEVRVCDPADGEVLQTFPYGRGELMGGYVAGICGRKLVLAGEEGDGFAIWDVEKGKKEADVSYGARVQGGQVLLEENGGLYFLDKEGIHHMNPEGTLVETLAEGGAMAMGDPQAYIEGFVKGPAEDFYALYGGEQPSVKRYYFDENAGSAAAHKLTVYSLKENDTVRKAISLFRQSHPEVEVSYKTGASDTASSRADQLRVLNTELLNGNGADVLLLDELPVDSLVEKGVLADISKILAPMIEEGTLQKNIGECYRQENGKIYYMPMRYGLPLLYGKQELTEAMGSLQRLEEWLASHPEGLMSGYSYGELTSLFLTLYAEELFGQDGKLSPEALGRCLSCIRTIGERYDAELENEYPKDFGSYGGMVTGVYPMGDPEEELVSYAEIKGMFDTMIPFQMIREKGYPMLYGNGSFLPYGVVGINSAAKEPELAEEFLKVLFSEELQAYDLQDGLPVNREAAKSLIGQGKDSLEDTDSLAGAVISVEGEPGEDAADGEMAFSFSVPLKEELKEMFDRAEELKKPATVDGVLEDMIREGAKAYYEGSQELGETVQGICTRVDTYRAQ